MKSIPDMTWGELCKHLNSLYSSTATCDLVTLRKLQKHMSAYDDADFAKLSIRHVEEHYPYLLLEVRHASTAVFLLYKRIIYPKAPHTSF